MKFVVPAAALLALATPALAQTHPTHAAMAQSSEDTAFRAIADRYVETLVRLEPVTATALGDHRYDGLLSDISAKGRAAATAEWRALREAAQATDPAQLSRDNQVDRLLLINDLDYRLWRIESLQSWAWNAQNYNEEAANALYTLAARDFAPWPQRLASATARMEALPAYLAESRRQLVAGRVPAIYAETVSKQNAGIVEVAETMLAPHAGELDPAAKARFDKALAALKTAVAEQQTWLDTVLVPKAKGDFRLGPALYDRQMAFELQSSMTRPELKAKAEKAKADIRNEMYALARQVLKDRALPEKPTADQQQAAIEAALQLSYAQRPPRNGLEQASRDALAQATDFVREKSFVGMPDGPVKVVTMPKFRQGNSVAYDDAPGPLERDGANFFAVSPIPDDWTEAQATSFLSEYNRYMIHDLAIHEAMPGHYLQLDHAIKDPSVLRAVLGSGPFVEGWAVYAEGLMKEQGYLSGDPLFQLTVLKMRLRSVTNTLLDIGIHTEGMTRDQAMDLMMKGAFQQEREAAGKWVRASLSSVQLLSYFTGYEEHRALREEAKQRFAEKFDLRTYNDNVLGHGMPPVKFVRELMFGLPIK
ncbi:DUF885 domain-containing protein [Novosphingobium olei]|uniref:DUF885 domain-containing protein n=1 Tax=Novosphingobium olei TaxID=2728851 RepID=A0A7Y0BQA0_9SPHN|nr:DUF885 domain-containing protein [Novosphingobium olei]NML94620.1 DUF885 domain-containing protein [Novosphingobium olei]